MSGTARQPAVVSQTAYYIGMADYMFTFPLAPMDLTRRHMTGAGAAGEVVGCGLPGAFVHVPPFPAEFRDTARPDFASLSRVAWLGLPNEPQRPRRRQRPLPWR